MLNVIGTPQAKSVALDGLAEAEARELLLKAARIPPDQHHKFEDDAKNVSALLKSHPLALIQAGSYVSRGHCNMSDYPQVYQRQRKRLLKFRPAQAQSRYGDVYATFEASADILQSSANEAAKDALQLLPILATLGPSRLPLSLFEAAWHGAQTIRRNADDDGTWIAWLRGMGLVFYHSSKQIKMHGIFIGSLNPLIYSNNSR